MASTESPKSKSKIIIISVLIIALLAILVTAYVFKDKIFGQKNTQTTNSAGQNVDSVENKPISDNTKSALPFFIVQGSGYDPKVMSAYEADKNPDKAYPNSVEISKIYDQNNKDLIAPKLKSDDKIVQDGGNYYIVQVENNKKVDLWSPKTNTLKTLEMPIEFDAGTFTAKNGKMYFADYNSGGEDFASGAKCGEFYDEMGKCFIYEVDPTKLKSNSVIGGVRSQING